MNNQSPSQGGKWPLRKVTLAVCPALHCKVLWGIFCVKGCYSLCLVGCGSWPLTWNTWKADFPSGQCLPHYGETWTHVLCLLLDSSLLRGISSLVSRSFGSEWHWWGDVPSSRKWQCDSEPCVSVCGVRATTWKLFSAAPTWREFAPLIKEGGSQPSQN